MAAAAAARCDYTALRWKQVDRLATAAAEGDEALSKGCSMVAACSSS